MLMAAIIAFNSVCFGMVTNIKNSVTMRLDELYSASFNGGFNSKSAAEKSADFSAYWEAEHHVLERIVRHELLEQITISVSRLYPLALHGESGEFASEISACRILIEEIWESERPTLKNIF